MDIHTAAAICHPPRRQGPSAILDDIMRDYRPVIAKALSLGFINHVDPLETVDINTRAFLRGMIGPDELREDIAKAQAALAKLDEIMAEVG